MKSTSNKGAMTNLKSQLIQEAVEETFKKVGSWYKVPIRKGMAMTMVENIDRIDRLIGGGCEVCGGKLVMIRGRHPGGDKRQVCPTCAVEIIESILDNCNNRQAYTELSPKESHGTE